MEPASSLPYSNDEVDLGCLAILPSNLLTKYATQRISTSANKKIPPKKEGKQLNVLQQLDVALGIATSPTSSNPAICRKLSTPLYDTNIRETKKRSNYIKLHIQL